MKNYVLLLLIVMSVFVSLQGCSSGGTATANADTVNTTTKVLASNVVLDPSNTSITANNVQNAFEEANPDLKKTLIGNWNVSNYGNGSNGEPGVVQFKDDGTFIVNNGRLAILDKGIVGADNVPITGKWLAIKNTIIQAQRDGVAFTVPITNEQVPYTVTYSVPLVQKKDKIVLQSSYGIAFIERAL